MKFVNMTRGVALANNGKIATSPWLRLKGLLGTKGMEEGEALLLRPCQSVHTFFMAYPIDVLFFDGNYRVVHLCSSMPPFRISRFVMRARFVIELPAGTVERTATQVGDLLSIETAE